MLFEDQKIKEILLSGNYLTAEDLQRAEKYADLHRLGFVTVLLTEGFITRSILGQAIAESLQIPYFDLAANEPSKEQVLKIPEHAGRDLRVVLAKEDKTVVTIATDNPKKELEKTLTEFFPQQKINVVFSLPEEIENNFRHYHKDLETRFSEIIEQGEHIAPEILEAIFMDAIALHTSDIHFEPTGEDVLIRFRIDGVLRDVGNLPNAQYENALNRIKVHSGIRLDEHFAAQDGAMQFQKNELTVDLRVSVVPTVEGEKTVLRVLSSYVQGLTLAELGLSEAHYELLKTTADKPFGMIVVVGPTGSGKSTTLYGLLKILNQSDVNITTIEDPVEYKLHGVNQIQVNPLTNLTFAKGLRSIVRQDPDIILVGEIRDQETAEIAVNAALTGHLLLSTFHANDAATAIPRMLDMGVEPFLLASTLELLVAQRLARRICKQCKVSRSITAEEISQKNPTLKTFFPSKKITLYEGKGCEACGHSGYKGRIALFEFIPVVPELKNIILKNPSSQEIWKLAVKYGAKTLFEDGIEKVKNGMTTLEELLRVAEAPN